MAQIQKLGNDDISQLFETLNSTFKLSGCQTYYPILGKFMSVPNTSASLRNYSFDTKYWCSAITSTEDVQLTNCIKAFGFIRKINKDKSISVFHHPIIVKIAPLLDPIKLLTNEYSDLATSHLPEEQYNTLGHGLTSVNLYDKLEKTPTNWLLPNLYNTLAIDKINSHYNTSYIETFAMYLLNKLVENGKCPTFPYFYGSVNGIKSEYFHDITDEYPALSHETYFLKQKNRTFELILGENNSEISFDTESDTSNLDITTDDFDDFDDNDNDNNNNNNNNNNDNNNNNNNNNILNARRLSSRLSSSSICSEKLSDNSSGYETVDEEIIKDSSLSSTSTHSYKTDRSFNSEFEDEDVGQAYVKLPDFPVQLNVMECLDYTLDELLDDDYDMSQKEWASILFQTAFGLAVVQKHHQFCHNDLHSDNIMFKKTGEKYLYFHIQNKLYKIPTFNKITKIIDYARGTFKVNNKWYLSDVFDKNGDADGQYNWNTRKFQGNYSFDLTRLGTTIIERLVDKPDILALVKSWLITDNGGTIIDDDTDTFDIYLKISKECHNAVPLQVLNNKVFKQFQIPKKYGPKNKFIYYF